MNKTHWCDPTIEPNQYNDVRAACNKFFPLGDIRYQVDEVSCDQCRKALIEYNREMNSFLLSHGVTFSSDES